MADVRPFAGLRYNLARFGDAQAMAQLIAPPYDVIDAEKRKALIAASPYNVVRLELPEGEDRYNEAARFLREWLATGILARDGSPAFYVYDEEYALPDGSKLTCRAIFAAVRLYDWADDVIMPHESTMTGPKADRLALLQATRANLSPIFSVYDDTAGTISQAINRGIAVQEASEAGQDNPVRPGFAFADAEGNRHRFSPVSGTEAVAAISAAFADKRLYIADGHHRYETALNYRNEQRAGGGDSEQPAEFVLMALTEINDPGLVILPTHRLITALSATARANLETHLAGNFAVEHFPTGDNPARTVARLLAEHKGEGHIFGAYGLKPGSVSLLRLLNSAAMADSPDHSAAWRELDVAILQKAILQDGIGMTEQTLAAGKDILYIKDPVEAIEMVEAGSAQLAFFLQPTPVTAVLAIADAHDRMPRKSTYFIPKLPTGVVMRSLEI
ncbi:MAG: DUF1015 domain-containing protein [Chloroflexi bacterium]|nr:DUF1015 domain-containing protein [Chloroflexota bacterium]OJV91895.1 MAG: hypothetical protein BGO39_14310 [Chloroflexi bacterium 54-19]